MKGNKEDQTEYLTQLRTELGQLDQSLLQCNRLVQEEIDRIVKGGDSAKPIEIHRDAPQKLTAKVLIPVKEYPKVNFVGKLIGPQGATLKRLQHELGCRLAIYGRGSMRDKNKEEELRKEGGKYAHLNDDLHIYIECNAPLEAAYERIGRALSAVKPYFDPNFDDGNLPPRDPAGEYGYNGSAPPPAPGAPSGRGMGRGAPRGRGAPPPSAGLGGPRSLLGEPTRGAAPPPRGRAAPRGGLGERRGAPAGGRGAVPMSSDRYGAEDSYYGASAGASYESEAYGAGYEAETPYSRAPPASRDPYARQAPGGDVQSFDYGHGAQGADRYSQQDAWATEEAAYSRPPAPRGRGAGAGEYRPRPYPSERPARPPPRY